MSHFVRFWLCIVILLITSSQTAVFAQTVVGGNDVACKVVWSGDPTSLDFMAEKSGIVVSVLKASETAKPDRIEDSLENSAKTWKKLKCSGDFFKNSSLIEAKAALKQFINDKAKFNNSPTRACLEKLKKYDEVSFRYAQLTEECLGVSKLRNELKNKTAQYNSCQQNHSNSTSCASSATEKQRLPASYESTPNTAPADSNLRGL